VHIRLKRKLIESVQRNRTSSGLLFSGGLDSAILASINPNIKAITISLKSYGEDAKYASLVAKFLNIEHYQKNIDVNQAIEAIPEVIKVLKTFDPAIPNDLVVYFGLRLAKELGINEIMTGDGSDELLAGYSFMKDIDDLDNYIKRISSSLQFSSNELGKFFNIKIKQPYLDNEVIDFCLKITKDFKIKKIGDRVWGKWILRKAFEDILPREVIWQDKRPLESGSGMTKIREIISSKVCDEEFRNAQKTSSIRFMNKEHFYYYKIYIKKVGRIPGLEIDQKPCPNCGAGMDISAFHCKICGNVIENHYRRAGDNHQLITVAK